MPSDTTPCREHILHGPCAPLTQQLSPRHVPQPPLPPRSDLKQMPSPVTGRLQKGHLLAQHPELLVPNTSFGVPTLHSDSARTLDALRDAPGPAQLSESLTNGITAQHRAMVTSSLTFQPLARHHLSSYYVLHQRSPLLLLSAC